MEIKVKRNRDLFARNKDTSDAKGYPTRLIQAVKVFGACTVVVFVAFAALTAYRFYTVKVWAIDIFSYPTMFAEELAFAPDSQHLAVISPFGDVKIWSINQEMPIWDYEPRISFKYHGGTIPYADKYNLSFSPDGKYLLIATPAQVACTSRTGGYDEWSKPIILKTIDPQDITALPICASVDTSLTICAMSDGANTIEIRNRPFDKISLEIAEDNVIALAISPDGSLLAYGNQAAEMAIYDIGKKLIISRKKIEFSPDNIMIFDSQGKYIAWKAIGNSIAVYAVKSGELQMLKVPNAGLISSCAFSPDTSRFAAGTAQGEVLIWDTENWSKIHTSIVTSKPKRKDKSQQLPSFINDLAFSPDNKYLLIAMDNSDNSRAQAGLFTADELKRISWLYISSLPAFSVTWSPDGKYIAAGGAMNIGSTCVFAYAMR